VVSLVPSVTETLAAWGLDPVACTRFCERPDLPVVGGTKNPDIAAIVAMAPDLVVVNDEENRREDAEALVHAGLEVHGCSPRAASEVAPELGALAGAVGLAGRDLPMGELDDVRTPLGVRAFVPIWRRPWMTLAADTYGASLLASIGVEVVGAPLVRAGRARTEADRYPEVELATVIESGPDVVLAPSEPYSFKPFHLEVLAGVAPVVAVDGQDLFWWGVRTSAAGPRLHDVLSGALKLR
jgi:ABC-type Fe3+-hydroxamate transport system substrate-binding protein